MKCAYCSLHTTSRIGNKVKHLYIFPNKYEADFEIFFDCPDKKRIRSYPQFQTELKCNKCGQYQDQCENTGYAWMCQSCDLEQFKLLEENIRMILSPFKTKIPSKIAAYFGNALSVLRYKLIFSMMKSCRTQIMKCLNCS